MQETPSSNENLIKKEYKNPLFSHKQKLWQFILLFALTLGLYAIYWFYRNWKQMYSHNSVAISAGWRTAGLFVPTLNLFLIIKQLVDMRRFIEKTGVKSYRYIGLIFIGYFLLFFIPNMPFVPDGYLFIASLSFLPLIPVQKALNAYWEKEQPNLPEKTALSWKEIIICCLGVVFNLLWLSVVLLPN